MHGYVTLDSRFFATVSYIALVIRCLAHSLPISFILQLCYVVTGSCLQTIVVAYHEFHMHSKTLHQQVTMARNDQSMQRV